MTEKHYKPILAGRSYMFNEHLGEIIFGIEKTYQAHLEKFGVSAVDISYESYTAGLTPITPISPSVKITICLTINGERQSRSWPQHVDRSAIEVSADELRGVFGATEDQVKAFLGASARNHGHPLF